MRRQEAAQHARLAQLVEHLLDVQEVTGSSPVPRTKSPSGHSGGDFSVYRRGKNQAKSPTFFKKGLAFCKSICYTNMRCQSAAQYARLAQLVEHLLDVQRVSGSSPLPRTSQRLEMLLYISGLFRYHEVHIAGGLWFVGVTGRHGLKEITTRGPEWAGIPPPRKRLEMKETPSRRDCCRSAVSQRRCRVSKEGLSILEANVNEKPTANWAE